MRRGQGTQILSCSAACCSKSPYPLVSENQTEPVEPRCNNMHALLYHYYCLYLPIILHSKGTERLLLVKRVFESFPPTEEGLYFR